VAKRPSLGVWLRGLRVAELTSKRGPDISFRYTEEALDRWPGNSPVLSCSLPLVRRRTNGTAYATGLLPEGQHRQAMARLANVAVSDTYALLARFGRDVAGALVISADEPQDRRGEVVPYSEAQLDDEVAALHDNPLALHDDSELSLAGLQDKMLLVRLPGGQWGRPVRGAPSTHILKVEDARFPRLARAEAACLHLARAVDLTTIEPSIEVHGGADCLIVSRFDREERDGVIHRVHQEDACQALDRDPDAANRRGKYQDAGGPSFAEIAELLETYALDPRAELVRLTSIATFTVCIGNADAHGKNIALLHPDGESVALAPLYDTVPTVLWPRLRSRAAMTINGQIHLPSVTVDDLVAEARRWSADSDAARAIAIETAERLVAAAPSVSRLHSECGAYVEARARALLETASQAAS
jgi:serine/threonine-protein kinase HipA